MNEILSQSEIDQLLTAITSTDSTKEEDTSSGSHKRIKIYDFKRPDKFSKEQIRTVRIIHETLVRLAITSLSTSLRALVNMRVYSVDQLSYEEFIRSIPSTTTIAVVDLDPLNGSAILEIDPTLSFSIIDRSFGGPGKGKNYERELTDIENAVVESVIVTLLGNMREAWTQVVNLRPRLRQIETNPQFAQVVHPTEMTLLVTLGTRINETEGMINLCLPYITLEPIASRLSAQYWYSMSRDDKSPKHIDTIRKEITNVQVEMKAIISKMPIKVQEMLDLKVGDFIECTQANITQPISIYIENTLKFLAVPGKVGKKMALHIVKQIDKIDDNIITELAPEE